MQNSNPIQWFPGHMAKTNRVMAECLSSVDIVIEVLDARIPKSSKNPDLDALLGQKPRITLLTKSSLADDKLTRLWVAEYKKKGQVALAVDSLTGYGIRDLGDAVRGVLSEKLQRYEEKGMAGRTLKAMIVGIPNVGKSSLINRLAKAKKAKVENRPGVTLSKQWIPTDMGLDLLDMPGVLSHKFDDRVTGENLAATGAIRDAILNTEEIAVILVGRLLDCARDAFLARYKLTEEMIEGFDAYDVFRLVGQKRGFVVSGGDIDDERCAAMLLEEFRNGKIGKITLEKPEGV